MALVCLCRGNFYWPPHTTILFCSIFLDKIVLDTLKSRYHRSAPLGIPSFFKKEIDLALLGIEKWADDRAYFCTPRKAGIIGRDGVSGALCRHELYRYAGTAGRRYDPCGPRRRGSPQTGALRPGSAEDYFVCSRDRVYRRCGWPGIRFCWRGAGKTSDGLFLASLRRRMWNSG